MLAESALRRQVSRAALTRGDDYFLKGRVRRVERRSDGSIEALVQGSQVYRVEMAVEGSTLIVRCQCRYFVDRWEECKHIWAAIRAASVRRLLPERALSIDIAEPDEDFDDEELDAPSVVRPFRQPAWEKLFGALGPPPSSYGPSRRVLPDEIAYSVQIPMTGAMLSVQILGRTRKKSGEWGKWRAPALQLDELQALEPFDAETIALLNQRSYSYLADANVPISNASAAWWIERLARAGKLLMPDRTGELQPVGWDDGPPWTFRVTVVNDSARSVYRIEGSIARDGEVLPLSDVTAITNGILISGGRASRFHAGGQEPWLRALQANGSTDVPHADAERFRRALLRAPAADIALPEELGWELANVSPRPVLALQHDAWGTELIGELYFDYGEWRVAARSSEMDKSVDRTLIRRSPAAEMTFHDRMRALGAIGGREGYRVRLQQLEELATTLIAEGWKLAMDATPLRVTDDIDVEISSGIDWFDLSASATFGEMKVLLPELLAAAEAKRSLFRLADGSFGIVPRALTESLAPVLDLGRREGDSIRFRATQALLIDALLASKKPVADQAFNDLRRLATVVPEPRQEPPTLTAELRPYQRAGLGWLEFLRAAGIGGCLADDMGLGKTVQALALLETLRIEGGKAPSLVVAPRSLLFNWAAEAARFAPQLRVLEHHGSERAKSAEAFAGYDVILTTYATMRLDVAWLSQIEFEYVILDEAQAIKNAGSQVAKASRLLRGRHRLALSGTPIENHLGELWSLFEFLNPGLLGSSRTFQRSFGGKNTPPERREALARAVRPLILRRTKEQVAPELPERIEQTLHCELEGKQKRLYDELRDHYRQALLGRVRKDGMAQARMQVLEALLRLRQAACHPALIDPDTDAPSAKTELLLEELGEVLDSGHRALVFSQFTSFLAIVRKALDERGVAYAYLDGKTQNRQEVVREFQSEDGPRLFLISLKAGGLGLNLTNADYIFLLDPWWNPAVEAQAIDRAHRIGRLRPVVAYRLIARDTVEEKILELQARKRELAESIISEDNSVLRKLEVEDLEMLLS